MYTIRMINFEAKYKDIVSVRPNFDDTFNILKEKPGAWKSFITNSQFESNLKKIFHALLATKSNINDRKSIWIQGTYGTGKSHSTSVIKHLLSDPKDEIEDFKKTLADIQLRAMIDDFRKNHKAFPVVLRGRYTIANVTDMSYEIQKQTRTALANANIDISINTDFDKAIELLDDPYMESFWNMLLKEDLKNYCRDKEHIRNSLLAYDKEILGIIDSRYRKINDGGFGTSSITKWLKDVQHELNNAGIADHLIIIWDEFTSLLSTDDARGFLNTVQDIAEIAKEFDSDNNPEKIYLIVVTHKNIEQTDAYRSRSDDEQKLALARFVTCSYEMQPNTTYHILSSTLNRIDESALKELVQERILSDVAVSKVVDKIAENTLGNFDEVKNKILSLYPFHPYTAYLSTFVSRQLGDAERSVFNFLNDSEVGFKKFIENKIGSAKFMAPSCIWDFFLKINNSSISNGKLGEVINKYNMHLDSVKKQGAQYVDIFKTVLLLNALNAVVSSGNDNNERSLVTPNIKNITDCYSGIMMEQDVIDVLEYFDKNSIIMRSADGVYEVSTASISPEKLNEMLKKNYDYYNDITKAKDAFSITFGTLENVITSNSGKTVRKTEVIYLSSTLKNNQIEVQLKSRFSDPFSVHVCVFLSHGPSENTKNLTPERNMDELETFIRTTSGLEEYKNVIFMNIEIPFTELWFSRFIDAVSRMDIHQQTKPEEFQNEKKKATGWLQKWINLIINDGQVFLAFRGNTEVLNFRTACNKISDDYIKFIFPNGLDILKTAKKYPIWEAKTSKTIVENILYYSKRDDIESKMKGGIQANIPALFKDDKNNYVFDNDMNIMPDVDDNHPVVGIVKKVNELLSSSTSEPIIDLSEKLSVLFEAPYGLYGNPISFAAVSIALRPYIDKLFIARDGTKVDKTLMKEVVEYLFKAANGGKKHTYLDVRFSSVEELELIDELNDIFNLHENGLMHIRWKARDSIEKNVKAPLWMLKYVDDISPEFSKIIDDLFNFTVAPDETITQAIISSLLISVQNYRLELKTTITKAKNASLLEKFIKLTLKGKDNNLSEDDIKEYEVYLNEHMQDSRPYWTESQLNVQINSAYFAKIQKKLDQNKPDDVKPIKVEPKESDSGEQTGSEVENTNSANTNKKENTKKQIKDCDNLDLLKSIIVDLIDNNDDSVVEQIMKKLNL